MNTESGNISENFIDVEKLLADKNPRLLRLLPGFLIRYLKHIAHQDTVNHYIYKERHLFGLPFVDAILDDFGVSVKMEGLENIPETGRIIVASNHPLGGLDGMALMKAVGKRRKDIVFPVNDLLMNLPGLRPLFIPINTLGSNAENIRIIENTFASDVAVLYFPSGMVSRKQKGVIKDLVWKKTFISKAKRHERNIVPAYIDGKNSSFFYNLANFRKKVGLKANIEMLYLVDEMMKQKSKTVTIYFGKPVSYTLFHNQVPDAIWAERMYDFVYTLKDNHGTVFNPPENLKKG